jgi:hypothetical protein
MAVVQASCITHGPLPRASSLALALAVGVQTHRVKVAKQRFYRSKGKRGRWIRANAMATALVENDIGVCLKRLRNQRRSKHNMNMTPRLSKCWQVCYCSC